MALRWNQIWSVMEAWDRQSDSSALRERLLAAAPSPKRARLTAHAVTSSTAAKPGTFVHAQRHRFVSAGAACHYPVTTHLQLQQAASPHRRSYRGEVPASGHLVYRPRSSNRQRRGEGGGGEVPAMLGGYSRRPARAAVRLPRLRQVGPQALPQQMAAQEPKGGRSLYRCGQCMDHYRDALSLELLSARLQAERATGESTSFTLDTLAKELHAQGKFDEAEPLFREVLEVSRARRSAAGTQTRSPPSATSARYCGTRASRRGPAADVRGAGGAARDPRRSAPKYAHLYQQPRRAAARNRRPRRH